jgi:membrane-bound serine protease (ClpP class)
MSLILTFLIVGVILLGSEVLLPSGLIGTIGLLCLALGIGLAFGQFGGSGGLLAAVGSLAASLLVILLEIKLLPRSRLGKGLFNADTSSGKAVDTGAATAPELVGQSGTALTTFAPTGLAEIGGAQYEAASLDGLLNVGDRLVVTGRDNYKLLVKKSPVA